MLLSPVTKGKRISLHRGERRARKLDLGYPRGEFVDQSRVELAAAGEAFQIVVQLEQGGERYDPLGLQYTGHVLHNLRMGVRIGWVAGASQQFEQAVLRRGSIRGSSGLHQNRDTVLSGIKDVAIAMRLSKWREQARQGGIRLLGRDA